MLVADNITKRFPGVIALEGVCMELYPGKVNAIIGENGAGKSTLMKIFSGVYKDYEGRILYKGREVHFANPKEAGQRGIAIIHQELNLIPYLSVMENIFLGRELVNRWGLLARTEMKRKTRELLTRLKLFIDPDTRVSTLKVGQQQVVEIAKALLLESEVIIMDEPTSAISESEVEVLFGIIADLKKDGKTIVYISHKLDELFRIADRYIVLRDGKTMGEGPMEGMTRDDIIRKMVGRDIKSLRKQLPCSGREELLQVRNLSLRHPARSGSFIIENISFSLAKGEIIGLFGLMGAGRTELLETIFGLQTPVAGCKISIENKPFSLKTPADAIKAGIALVPEDRKKDGLIQGLDVQANICLTTLQDMEQLGLLSGKKEASLTQRYIGDLRIKTSGPRQLAKNLSGGNQQKIVLAKWLATNPRVLMLDEPTRGIDINAKNEIYKLILNLADKGMGIIMVSSELPEILAVSDRVLVMAEGVITADLPAADASENNILKAAIPNTN